MHVMRGCGRAALRRRHRILVAWPHAEAQGALRLARELVEQVGRQIRLRRPGGLEGRPHLWGRKTVEGWGQAQGWGLGWVWGLCLGLGLGLGLGFGCAAFTFWASWFEHTMRASEEGSR